MNPPSHRRAFVALTAVLLVYVSWEAFRSNPGGSSLEQWDKVLHFSAFCSLALSAALALAPGRRSAWVVIAGLLAYGAFIEVVQAFIPGREASVLDWLADACGIAGGLAAAAVLRRLPVLRPGSK